MIKCVISTLGKRSPVTILRNDGETYEYRTKRRLKETRRLQYNRMIDIRGVYKSPRILFMFLKRIYTGHFKKGYM